MSLPPPSTIIRGRTWVWPDDVNTDIIIPFRFKARTNDPVEMAKYAMYGFDPEFYKKVKPGDLFVAGKNLEAAPAENRRLSLSNIRTSSRWSRRVSRESSTVTASLSACLLWRWREYPSRSNSSTRSKSTFKTGLSRPEMAASILL